MELWVWLPVVSFFHLLSFPFSLPFLNLKLQITSPKLSLSAGSIWLWLTNRAPRFPFFPFTAQRGSNLQQVWCLQVAHKALLFSCQLLKIMQFVIPINQNSPKKLKTPVDACENSSASTKTDFFVLEKIQSEGSKFFYSHMESDRCYKILKWWKKLSTHWFVETAGKAG